MGRVNGEAARTILPGREGKGLAGTGYAWPALATVSARTAMFRVRLLVRADATAHGLATRAYAGPALTDCSSRTRVSATAAVVWVARIVVHAVADDAASVANDASVDVCPDP